MRKKFKDIFRFDSHEKMWPNVDVNVNGLFMGENMLGWEKGVSTGGIELWIFKDYDIEGHYESGVFVIDGFYKMV